ncbi:NF-X1-type zinc finger protein NFXL1 [Pleurostoma richardsiae]|uniref:NF-X1-type zinc finger protein NFXL1 n=1 Tax=Pleurostoma richardsiae TaxID=41990 RepID=A0AA38VXE0_9PEZI|nr:NF-X1-type zinc finger protein NFXL1 [Pleurostoma richardsiae]
MLKNQPCWFEEVRCGLPCGKVLKCGAHTCQKLCHRSGQCEDADIVGSHCTQPCGKTRKTCDHACIEQCHAPFPCKEDKPCQLEAFITCECQRRKQKVKCLASKSNPGGPAREPLRCDDECLRMKRNRQLADALNIDPETHSDNHIPYQDLTLKFFRDNIDWAQTQEREFRLFAESDLKYMRLKPMKPHQRQFLHVLAEDFGFDSESQDPEPHRHVCLFKGPRFVSAPRKTLMQCLKISRAAAAAAARPAPPPAPKQPSQQPFNALLLTAPRFGLTVDELNFALAADLAAAATAGPALTFVTSFLPSDEVIIKAAPKSTVASVASAPAPPTPLSVESALAALKPKISKTASRLGLAGGVALCHADASLNVVRREGDSAAAAGGGGWSTVASRAASRRAAPATAVAAAAAERKAPSAFLALRKIRKKEESSEPLEEDWEAAADKLEGVADKAEEETKSEVPTVEKLEESKVEEAVA